MKHRCHQCRLDLDSHRRLPSVRCLLTLLRVKRWIEHSELKGIRCVAPAHDVVVVPVAQQSILEQHICAQQRQALAVNAQHQRRWELRDVGMYAFTRRRVGVLIGGHAQDVERRRDLRWICIRISVRVRCRRRFRLLDTRMSHGRRAGAHGARRLGLVTFEVVDRTPLPILKKKI